MSEKPQPLRALIVEDSEDDALLLIRELSKGGFKPDARRVDGRHELAEALDGQAWDVVLSDFVLPDMDGLLVLEMVRERDREVPFILFSGRIGERMAVQALKAGATDYVSKDNFSLVVPAVRQALNEARLRRAKEEADARLKASEERYRQLVELAPVAIVVARRGRVALTNGAARSLLGTSGRQDLEGRRLLTFIPPDKRKDVIRWMRDLMRKNRSLPLTEMKLRRLNGAAVETEITVAPFTCAGEPGFQAVIRDVSARKREEKRLFDTHHKLQSLALRLSLSSERERRKIADELHNRVGQLLALVKMKLSALRSAERGAKSAGRGGPDEGTVIAGRELDALEELDRAVAEVIEQTRGLTYELCPPVLYRMGLAPALEWLVERAGGRYGMDCRFDSSVGEAEPLEGSPRSEEIKVFLYEAVRELMHNAAKHAQANVVWVRLRAEGGNLVVRVEDDGTGFDREAVLAPEAAASAGAHTEGFGLFSLGVRARHMGGTLEVESAPGQGTRARISVPVEAPETGDTRQRPD